MCRLKCLVLVLSACVLFSDCGTVAAQTPGSSALTIISPLANATFEPGQTVSVLVTRSQGSGITQVALSLFHSLSGVSTGADPLLFSITIPASIKSGIYPIVAVDVTPRTTLGIGAMSSPVTISIESPTVFTSVRPNFASLPFQFVGDSASLSVTGTATGAAPAVLKNSSKISYLSQNSGIATVTATGTVMAMGPGNTSIVVTYTNPNQSTVTVSVPVFVPSLSRGDLNGDGKVDTDDLSILDAVLNTPANGPNDARDLNHDGVINALDARILTTLCTYPRCVTHQ